MIIKSIKLKNIRSYLDAEIAFPLGSTLLAGDIGSGKSTILLAMEFALFGAKRGMLPANSLLRHGKNDGSVELEFSIDESEITIKRFLKRAKEEIKQDTGYIIINGRKKEGTAIELKAIVLELLGYPKELLTKSKDLLYRYTVYTPQEEMKQILMEDKEVRLDTLRKVFNIEKYKRVRENTEIFTRRLRELARGYETLISDLEPKQKILRNKMDEIKLIETKIIESTAKLINSKKRVEDKKTEIKRFEDEVATLNKIKKDLEVSEVELRNRLEQVRRNNAEIERLASQIKIIEGELIIKDIEKLDDAHKEIEQKEKEILSLEKNIREIQNKISEYNTKIKHSQEIKNKISKLDACPTCEQSVTAQYKEIVREREENSINELGKECSLIHTQADEMDNKLQLFKKQLNDWRKSERELEIIKIKRESLLEKKRKKEEIESMVEDIKKDVGSINKKRNDLNGKLALLKGIDEQFIKAKSELDSVLLEERKAEIEKTSYEKEIEGINKLILEIEKEVNGKLKTKESLVHMKQLNNWLENHFIKLMGVIERHIMLQLHREFNELFESWFDILIEDDTISVRIDEEFTPIIEQNGYETLIENLSGGEKTSVALSYRLALNKVINDIVSGIKTKELIMLDEPTDGFSSEQLDKVRDVLDRLEMKQAILVSHESKIESFVNNVIRVHKEEHVSSIGQ